MFWKSARNRYKDLRGDDPDIIRWLDVSGRAQIDVYRGVAAWIQDLGHKWIASRTSPGTTLEIGFGTGRHLKHYRNDIDDYYVSDISDAYMQTEAWRRLKGRSVCCDARNLPFGNEVFDNVISMYNLEHIKDLHTVIEEVRRVLKLGGYFLVAVPCEGGLLWNLGRELTTRRWFQKKYNLNYDKAIAYEHVWNYEGINNEIKKYDFFQLEESRMYPSYISTPHLNLIACIKLKRLM